MVGFDRQASADSLSEADRRAIVEIEHGALAGFQSEPGSKPKPGGQRERTATESGLSLNRQTQGPAESRENLRA
jgi:hypothetical protein